MEWWILLGLTVIALAVGAINLVRRHRRQKTEEQTGNIYPLW
jgi:hypothetical protein